MLINASMKRIYSSAFPKNEIIAIIAYAIIPGVGLFQFNTKLCITYIILIAIFLILSYRRKVAIELLQNTIKIKTYIFNVTLKESYVNFDKVVISPDTISFYFKGNLLLFLDAQILPNEEALLGIDIRQSNKNSFFIGNQKNANEIFEFISEYLTLYQ